jgi:hypothetical protein
MHSDEPFWETSGASFLPAVDDAPSPPSPATIPAPSDEASASPKEPDAPAGVSDLLPAAPVEPVPSNPSEPDVASISTGSDDEDETPIDGSWGAVAAVGLFTLFWTLGTTVGVLAIGLPVLDQRATSGWEAVDGWMHDSAYESFTFTDSEGGSSTEYCPVVTYTWERFGDNRTGHVVSLTSEANCWSSEQRAETFVAEHPSNAPVTVYVDPLQPDRAVLQQGLVWQDVGLLFFMLPFVLVSLVLLGVSTASARAALRT